MSGRTRGCGCTGRAGHGPAAGIAGGCSATGFAGGAATAPRQRGWAPRGKVGAGSGCHGVGAGLGTGKIVLNQRLGEAVVAGASRPGERWQEAAGSAELFLAAAGAGERA